MKIFTLLFLVFGISSAAFSQATGSVTGIVLFDGNPVDAASVRLADSSNLSNGVETRTDRAGRFRFDGVRPGKYAIVGFSRVEITIDGKTSEQTADSIINVDAPAGSSLDLTLNLTIRQISSMHSVRETVEISADFAQPIDEVSKTVNVISGQEMRDRADITLVDTLRTIPGFRVQQLGGFGRTASIKTRGLRNQDTAVLIDGIRFRDAASITGDATPFLSDFTLTSVSRVEVLRGSGSSLYGTNAIGGTLDFQTPRAPAGLHGQFSGAAGGLGLGRFRGNLSYGSQDGRFGISGGAARTVYSKGIDGNDRGTNTNVQTRVEFKPTDKTNISGRLFASDAFVRLNSSPARIGPFLPSNATIIVAEPGVTFSPDVDDPDDIQRSNFFNGQIVFSQVLTSNLILQAYYSGLKTSRENETGPLGTGFQFSSLNTFEGLIHTANANIQWSPGSSNRFTAGFEFEQERFGNDSSSEFGGDLTTRARQGSSTIYVQHLAGFLDDRLQLAGGFRAQFFDLSTPRFSVTSPLQNITLENPPSAYTFDGSASYIIRATGTKVRVHAGNGYRAPSLYERFASFFGAETFSQLFLAGAPDLEPERSVAFDAGIEQKFFKERARLTATYFYTRLFEAIGYGFLPQPDRFGRVNAETFGGYLNTGGLIARGAEFSVDTKLPTSTEIFASYTFTNSDQRNPQVQGSGVITSLGVPSHQFTAVVTQRIKRFWTTLDFVGTSSYLAPLSFSYVYRFGGSRRLDLTAGYTFGMRNDKLNLRLFGTVENLLDHEYFENGFRTAGRNGRIGLSFAF